MKKVLIISFTSVGDTILCIPMYKALGTSPNISRVDLLIFNTTIRDLLIGQPVNLIYFPSPSNIFSFSIKFLMLLKTEKYDVFILPKPSIFIPLLAFLMRVPEIISYEERPNIFSYLSRFLRDLQRIAPQKLKCWISKIESRLPYPYSRWGGFLTHPIFVEHPEEGVYVRHSRNTFVNPLGVVVTDNSLDVNYTSQDKVSVELLLKQHSVDINRPIAIFNCFASSQEKSIPLEHYALSLSYLRDKGYQIICTGALDTSKLYDEFRVNHHLESMVNLAGQTTIRELVYLCSKADILLTIDTGTFHVGIASKTPQIFVLFKSTNPDNWLPEEQETKIVPIVTENNP